MEFRLTYEGILLGASRNDSRARHKQEIRKVFHQQLRRLWENHPAFYGRRPGDLPNDEIYLNQLAHFHQFGFKFLPLVPKDLSLLCSVQILFLRPDVPGQVIQSGDIDNRLKTIFDALRLPHDVAELGGYTPDTDEDPFFCLLEDDSLIVHASIEADTLLQPTGPDWKTNDARIVLTVSLRPYKVTFQNIGFG